MMAHFDSTIEAVQVGLNNIQGSSVNHHHDWLICDQIMEVHQLVSANNNNISDLSKRVQVLEKENIYLRVKSEEAENRSWSSNLRFIGIPEHK